jgi:hypothetical protein
LERRRAYGIGRELARVVAEGVVGAERAGCVGDSRRLRELHGRRDSARHAAARGRPPPLHAHRFRDAEQVRADEAEWVGPAVDTLVSGYLTHHGFAGVPRVLRLLRARDAARARRGQPGVAEDMPEVVGAQDPELSRDRLSLEAWATM